MSKNDSYKVAFVASVAVHLVAFHLPFMQLMRRRGYEVHTYARPDKTKNLLEKVGVICHDVPFQRGPFHKENMQSLRLLTNSFKTEKFRMIHVHTPVAGVLGRIAAKRASIPVVLYTAHGFHFYKGAPWRHWLTYYPLERLLARYTDIIVTINREDYRRAKQFPVRDQVVYVPGVGLDINYYKLGKRSSLRGRLGIREQSFVISCIAELIARKNQLQLIQAVQSMVLANRDVQCLFVGEGEMEKELKEHVRRLGIKPFVKFLGNRDDIPQILSISDVCVLLSKQEGLPRAVMEAMAAGKPVVATHVRGNHDLIEHGSNGFLVPVGHVEATVDALEKLYQQPELRVKMGEASKKQILSYDITRIIPQMAGIYRLGLEQWDAGKKAAVQGETVSVSNEK